MLLWLLKSTDKKQCSEATLPLPSPQRTAFNIESIMTPRWTVVVVCFVSLVCTGSPGHGFLLPTSTLTPRRFDRLAQGLHGFFRNKSNRKQNIMYLYSKSPKRNDDESLQFQLPSPYTLLIDGLAILLAVELVGLLNEVNDVNFMRNGGWFQPLPSFEEQSISISKVLQGWILNMALWVSTLTIAPVVFGQRWSRPDANRFLPCFLLFATLRIAYPVVTATLNTSDAAVLEPLLDTYVIGLLLGTARFLLGEE